MWQMKPFLFLVVLATVLLFSCKNETKVTEEGVETVEEVQATADNSKNALDWNGQYKGLLPCADCEGIATTLTLSSDGSYQRVMYYRGKTEDAFVDRGTFSWDDSGSVIRLALEDGSSQSYKVGENQLWHLDREEQMIKGDLADQYLLKKNRMDTTLENKRWVLKELMGQAIETKEGEAEAHIEFNSENAMLYGNNGCNRISMGYELLEGKRIRIAPGISTLMACPDESISETFNEVLGRVDNYTVYNGELQLNKARMAPLAILVEQKDE
jgi:uncharacterized lipoprotein NlpE involved in copper resistance